MKLVGVQDFGNEIPTATSKTTDRCADHALVFMLAAV